MNSEELEALTQSIFDKLGEENSALIVDDVASIITKNNETISTIKELKADKEKLKSRNDMLIDSNAKLMQQIPRGPSIDDVKEEKETENTKIDLMSCFDEMGRLKSRL